MDVYTDIERYLLVFIISQGSVLDTTAIDQHAKFRGTISKDEALREVIQDRTLVQSIDLINKKLEFQGYAIQSSVSQTTGQLYYVYCNKFSDEASKLSLGRNAAKEVSVIKQMIEQVITDDNESYAITSKDALKICSGEGLSGVSGVHFLQSLSNEGWFDVTRHGQYTLSIRSLTELKQMLLEKYGIRGQGGLMNICIGCKELVTIGVRCAEEECNVRFHEDCQGLYATAHGDECPGIGCVANWRESTLGNVGPTRLM